MTIEIDKNKIYYKNLEIKEATVDIEKRTFKAVISSEVIDREGEVIKVSGMNLKQFKKIGVLLFNHNRDLVLGSPTSVKRVGKDIVMEADFADEGTGEKIDEVYKLVKQGHLKTMSIGFQYLERPRQPTKEDVQEFGKGVQIVAQKTLLLEASIVSVPANQDAIILSCKEMGVDPKVILGDDYKEEIIEDVKEIVVEDVELIEETKDVEMEDNSAKKEEISKKDILIERIKKELRRESYNKEVIEIIKEELIKNELIKKGRIYY